MVAGVGVVEVGQGRPGVVMGVVILILVVSMVTIRDNTERGEDLKSAYIRGIMNITRTVI